MVDTGDSKSPAVKCVGSSPTFRTRFRSAEIGRQLHLGCRYS